MSRSRAARKIDRDQFEAAKAAVRAAAPTPRPAQLERAIPNRADAEQRTRGLRFGQRTLDAGLKSRAEIRNRPIDDPRGSVDRPLEPLGEYTPATLEVIAAYDRKHGRAWH